MPSLRTPRKTKNRHKTYRSRRSIHGGAPDTPEQREATIARLKAQVDAKFATDAFNPVIVNPESKFVLVTYWWGGGNLNKNTQLPCIADLQEEYLGEQDDILWDEDSGVPELEAEKVKLASAKRALLANPNDAAQKKIKADAIKEAKKHIRNILGSQNMRRVMNEFVNSETLRRRASGEGRDPIAFRAMIDMWKRHHSNLRINHLAVEFEIGPSEYQYGINIKPYFIKKSLEKCSQQGQNRSVLYIDGDMFANKFPRIFETQGVDLMLRGWGIDPRSNNKFLNSVCFDPYIIETSGGTMFFGNTPNAHTILNDWDAESCLAKNAGKADDRILSMVLSLNNWGIRGSIILLPIEYLWLTNDYEKNGPLKQLATETGMTCDPIIEHPACLTSEDTATGGTSSREPDGYWPKIGAVVDCKEIGGTFYEYIFFEHKRDVPTFGPYLNYIKTATNSADPPNNKLFNVVSWDEKYGQHNQTATTNLTFNNNVITPYGNAACEQNVMDVPPTTPDIIKVCLGHLRAGHSVRVGGDGTFTSTSDIRITPKNIIKAQDQYTVGMPPSDIIRRFEIDTTQPIYFSCKNPIVMHLLAMCENLESLNVHLKDSYMFTSRISWQLEGAAASMAPGAATTGQAASPNDAIGFSLGEDHAIDPEESGDPPISSNLSAPSGNNNVLPPSGNNSMSSNSGISSSISDSPATMP